MRAEEFLKELEYLLQDIPEEEKRDAISYYQDYLEDAGDGQEDAIREFGSPERVAAIIRADLAGSLEGGGGFTDTGYQDERFRDPRYQVVRRKDLPERTEAAGGQAGSGSREGRERGPFLWERYFGRRKGTMGERHEAWGRRRKVALLLVLLVLAAPFLLGLGKTMSGIAAGILGLAFVAVILVGLLTGIACIGAVCALVAGFGLLFADGWTGVLVMGGGILLLGLGLVGIALSILIYGMLLPRCIGGAVDWIGRMLHRERRMQA